MSMEEKSTLFRRHSPRYVTLDEDSVSEVSWPSRPNTQSGMTSSCSRLSSDSGAGSIEDFNRRGSSPLPTTFLDYWDGVRRHTAPPRKTPIAQNAADYGRPNTVHAWDVYPSRSTLSRYTPLPAIGTKPTIDEDSGERQRKYCFQEVCMDENVRSHNEEDDNEEDEEEEEDSHREEAVFHKPDHLNVPKLSSRLASLCLESDDDDDSDFDEESESGVVCPTDDEEDEELERERKRRPIVRSATFTIEDKKKEESSEDQPTESLRLLLAIRLPDGSRVAGYFDSKDSLREVCSLAQEKLTNPLGRFELVTTEVPKRTFSDFSVTLEDAGIVDKTLLNLQLCEDEDSE